MPKVGIIMGSDSDLKVMSKAAVMLEELGIEYEMTIISAHREPDELIEWTRGAEDRGIKVMICLLYTSSLSPQHLRFRERQIQQ